MIKYDYVSEITEKLFSKTCLNKDVLKQYVLYSREYINQLILDGSEEKAVNYIRNNMGLSEDSLYKFLI